MNQNKMMAIKAAGGAISMADLDGIAAVGFNGLGGGITVLDSETGTFKDTGVSLFKSADDAMKFVADAPVSRDVIYL